MEQKSFGNKVFYVPLEIIKKRYTGMMDKDLQAALWKARIPFQTIHGIQLTNEIENGAWLDSESTIYFKCSQLQEITKLFKNGEVKNGDVFFFSDLWFPGIESIKYMAMFRNINVKICGIFHAGSWIDADYVAKLRDWVLDIEDGWFNMDDMIFLGTEFHKTEILKKIHVDSEKLHVTGLPFRPQDIVTSHRLDLMRNKEDIVIFNGRLDPDKRPDIFDKLAKQNPKFKFIKTMELPLSKDEYYDLMARSKVIYSCSEEETFGYGILEGFLLGCIPLLPDKLTYPEMYPKSVLYKTFAESILMLHTIMDNYEEVSNSLDNHRDFLYRKYAKSSMRIAHLVGSLLMEVNQ